MRGTGWRADGARVARRAGVRPATYVLFERIGRASLVRFIAILDVLDLSAEVEQLAKAALPVGAVWSTSSNRCPNGAGHADEQVPWLLWRRAGRYAGEATAEVLDVVRL